MDEEKKVHAFVDDESALSGLYQPAQVKRGLKERHVQLIVLGGTIGTGLFISTGNIIAQAGPGLALISFLFIATLAYTVTMCLGEMTAYIPITGSFAQFTTRWVSPAIGAANGWNYWFSWAITFALELSIVLDVIEYWDTGHKVPKAAWISIFLVLLTAVNFLPVVIYGEIEFIIAAIKVIAVVGWIIYALCMVCGAGQTGPVGFRYWNNPGPWGPGYLVEDKHTGRFLGWVLSLISAAFTFQGTETIGLTAGESSNPTKTIPLAVRKVIWRILIFYILLIFFLGLLVPYNDPRLGPNLPEDLDIAYSVTSPFIIAMLNSGTKVLPDIFNAVILSTIILAALSNVYLASRTLYGLSEAGVAPKFFMRTPYLGVPIFAVGILAAFGALGYLAVSVGGQEAFLWLLNISAVAGMITWFLICVSYLRFYLVLKRRGISRSLLPFRAPFMPYAAYYAAFVFLLIIFIQGFAVFWDFTAADFFVSYISPIFAVFCWIVFQVLFSMPREGSIWHRIGQGFVRGANPKNMIIPLDDCDIDTGRIIRDDYEPEPRLSLWGKIWKFIT